MNTTDTINLSTDRPTTIQATGSELLALCQMAQRGELIISGLIVTGNGSYAARVRYERLAAAGIAEGQS